MQAEAFVHLSMDEKVSESLLEAEWIAPSNRGIQRKTLELEERLTSDPAKADVAYDHHTRIEYMDCRREELLQYDPRDRI